MGAVTEYSFTAYKKQLLLCINGLEYLLRILLLILTYPLEYIYSLTFREQGFEPN
jgi:hypothetical protein